jgi:hypothetical protein
MTQASVVKIAVSINDVSIGQSMKEHNNKHTTSLKPNTSIVKEYPKAFKADAKA